MRRFTFTLESVRALREQAERQAMQDLAVELAHHAALAADVDAAVARLSAAQSLPTGASGADLIAREAFVARRKREAAHANALAAAQEAQVEARRAELQEKAREREALERLKEQRRAEHARAAARAEQEQLLELSLTSRRPAFGEAA